MILITLLLYLLVFSIVEKKIKQDGLLNIISLSVLSVAFSSSYFNGVDWPSYERIYKEINSINLLSLNYEPVFLILFRFLSGFGFEFQGAIVVYFLFLSGGLLLLANRLRVPLSWIGFVFTVFFYFDLIADQIRQAFSVMLLLHALLSLINRKIIGFIIFSLLAIGFHFASAVVIGFAAVSKTMYSYNKNRYALLLIFISIALLVGIHLILEDLQFNLRFIFPDQISSLRLFENLLNESVANDLTKSLGVFFIFSLMFILLSLFRLNRIYNYKDLLIYGGILIGSCLQIYLYQYPFLQRITQYFFIFPVLFLYFQYKNMTLLRKNFDTYYAMACIVFGLLMFLKGLSNDIRRDLLYNPKFYMSEVMPFANMISTYLNRTS